MTESEFPEITFDFSNCDEEIERRWLLQETLLPTTGACWDRIANDLDSCGGIPCPKCGHTRNQRENGSRTARCESCRTRFSITVGTGYHRVRKPKLKLFMGDLMDDGVPFNLCNIQKVTGAPYSTVHMTFTTLASAVESRMTQTVDALSLAFEDTFAKRSRVTPANQPPRCEEPAIALRDFPDFMAGADTENLNSEVADNTDAIDAVPGPKSIDKNTDATKESDSVTDDPMALLSRQILQCLGREPIFTEQLAEELNIEFSRLSACLMMLDLDGLVERLPGDRYILAKASTVAVAAAQISPHATIANAIAFIRELYGGVSRKYLNLYLAMHWTFSNRATSTNSPSLIECIVRRQITFKQVLNSVCPLVVQVFDVSQLDNQLSATA